jgi:hypothetical protein
MVVTDPTKLAGVILSVGPVDRLDQPDRLRPWFGRKRVGLTFHA